MSTAANQTLNGKHFPGSQQAAGKVANSDTVEQLIASAFDGKFSTNNVVRLGDDAYYLPTLEEVEHILSTSAVDAADRKWVANKYDCDDFSYVLKGAFSTAAYLAEDRMYGFALGIIWADFKHITGYHAINVLVLNDESVMLIEPQGNFIYPASNCSGKIGIIVI